MKKFIYTIIGIVLLSLSSCSDFLEPKSQSEYVPKDANALQEMLIGSAYPQHKSGNNLLGFLSFLDDDVQFHKTGYEFDSNSLGYVESKKAVFTWQPDMFFIMEKNSPVVYNIWEGYYKFILGANAALDYIGDVNGTEAEKNYVIAQALGLRAFYYFMLVNHFGAPYNYDKQAAGVPLKLTSNLLPEEDLLMTRNSVEEVYNQIIEDLSEAERLFLTLSKDKQYEPNYLISLPMIQLLKSRVFLYMENWKDAAIYADKVINEWSFSLINLNNLPSTSTAEPYYNFTSLKSSEVIWLYGNVSDLTEFNNETVSREEEDPDYPGWGINITYYRKAFTASDDLLESFKDGDLRKEKYIAKEYNRINNSFYPDYYSSFGKYQLSAMGEPNGSENFALSFRLSEAYLNLAEAAAYNNEESKALSAMRTLLENRYEPEKLVVPAGLTGETLKNFIKAERRKELCFEGQRWFDLRRYGMPQITHEWEGKTYTLKSNDPSYTMPIPDEVLIKNGACNICTTDYGQYTGARKNLMFPMAWGHEFAGTIVDMGSDVKEFEVGEMVGIGYDNCGECEFCKKGLTSECVTLGAGRNKLSPDGYHGGFGCSEYVIKPYRSLFKLNQNMDPSEAAFVEPVGTVCQGIRKLRVQQGEKIVVIGAGTMGVLNALVAKAEGCEVMITEMMDKKIEVAKELGLNVVDVKEKDPVEAVKEWTDGRGVDAVILAVGVTAANDQALEMIKRLHGRILMFAAGYPAPELHVDSNLIHYRKMELIGTFSADKCDFERAAELMREKKIDLSKLVEAKYKLDDVEQAFEAAIVPGAYRVSVVFD